MPRWPNSPPRSRPVCLRPELTWEQVARLPEPLWRQTEALIKTTGWRPQVEAVVGREQFHTPGWLTWERALALEEAGVAIRTLFWVACVCTPSAIAGASRSSTATSPDVA